MKEEKERLELSKQYMELLAKAKEALFDKNDYQVVVSKKGDTNQFIKKSGYIKLAKHFNITILDPEIDMKISELGNISLAWCRVKAQWKHPVTGKLEEAVAVGACDSREKKGKNSNDVYTTAHTRAVVRVIAFLVSFGQVGADEVTEFDPEAYNVDTSNYGSKKERTNPFK